MNADLSECVTATLEDAEDANISVGALVELLRGCPPDYPLSAGLFLGLVVSVKAHLENVADGLRVVTRHMETLHVQTPDREVALSL